MGRSDTGRSRAGRFRRQLEKLITPADIRINGERPWDIQVHDDRFFRWVLAEGSMGLGESYMDGLWDCERLDELIRRLLTAGLDQKVIPLSVAVSSLYAKLINAQTPARSFKVGKVHYDLGNELYRHMLDKRMIYSCGYWKEAENLDKAQEHKLDLICRKLELGPGMKVLDIGCGWGGTARFIAERYGCSVVGITISEEQASLARQACTGLPVDIRLEDYRSIGGQFDRVLSVGMFEHVGARNHRTFMKTVSRNLKAEGLFLLHSIGSLRSISRGDPWMERYIFPNSMLPSAQQIAKAAEGLFVMEDWHNFGAYYDTTLMHWYRNFTRHWNGLSSNYDRRFFRMWTFFLLASARGFRARRHQVWQIVFSPRGVRGIYPSIR
jgi:cyclopropane-fatty-acyl-phospholipid synthase